MLKPLASWIRLFKSLGGASKTFRGLLAGLLPVILFIGFVFDSVQTVPYLHRFGAWIVERWTQPSVLQHVVVVLGVLAVTILIIAILFAVAWHKLRRRVDTVIAQQKQPVLFVPPSLEGFYSEYLAELVRAARKHAGAAGEITIVPYVDPSAEFCPEERLTEILEYIDHGGFIKGVFIIPKHPQDNQKLLQSFGKRPIVTLDVYPDVKEVDDYPQFVGGNETMGGRCASVKAIQLLNVALQSNPTNPKVSVLVLRGRETKWENQRVESFVKELRAWAKQNGVDLSIVLSKLLEYDYERAHSYLAQSGAEQDWNGNSLPNPMEHHLIFACSDTMALGAAKALRGLREKLHQKRDNASSPKIIGYDGTTSMKRLLDAGTDLIAATVDVQLQTQAQRAVQAMMGLLREQSKPAGDRKNPPQQPRMIRVDPRIYPEL